jgi:predicted AlkP superfamily pyrophosphatase or phosphodiesterase
MKKLLTLFLDGLKPESLEFMPFLNSFEHKARIETQLGYSVACHANMYTGVFPDKHGLWFVWKRSPQTSPFKNVKFARYLPFINTLPGKLILHKLATISCKNTSWFGIPRIIHMPVKYWPYIDVSEKKMYCEEGYIEKYPTLFDILRRENVPFEVVGMDKSEKEESRIIEKHRFSQVQQWTYLFMGDVDHFSHKYCQNSKEGIARLRALDALLEKKYAEYSKCVPDFNFILFSDHGHIPVKLRIDVYAIFREKGIDLKRYLHIIDVNYLRIWVKNNQEKELLEEILVSTLKGFVLTPQLLQKYRLPLDRREHGDIIFYLDAPCIFSKTIWGYSRGIKGYSRGIKSMHGYLPSYSDSDGVLTSNLRIGSDRISLIDILPSHLQLLNIEIPEYVEGKSIWVN